MLWAVLSVVVLGLLVGGGLFGYREYLRGKPDRIWLPLTLRADFSMEDQKKLAEQIEAKLKTDEVLRQIVIDVDLQKKFSHPTQEAAIKDLKRRLFVETSTADTPSGTVPSVNIGVAGKGGEHDVLGEATTRLIKDVSRMMGIDPETGKPINSPGVVPAGTGDF